MTMKMLKDYLKKCSNERLDKILMDIVQLVHKRELRAANNPKQLKLI